MHSSKAPRLNFYCFVVSDAIILNSLCEMFGLLDSVKQALDQRRSQIDENKVHDYGEKTLEDSLTH